RGAFSAGSSLISARVFSRSESCCSAGKSAPPESLTPPFGNRMQRRVLQKLRAARFDPGVRSVAQPRMEFLNEPRLECTLENDLYERSSVKWRYTCSLHGLCGA